MKTRIAAVNSCSSVAQRASSQASSRISSRGSLQLDERLAKISLVGELELDPIICLRVGLLHSSVICESGTDEVRTHLNVGYN